MVAGNPFISALGVKQARGGGGGLSRGGGGDGVGQGFAVVADRTYGAEVQDWEEIRQCADGADESQTSRSKDVMPRVCAHSWAFCAFRLFCPSY